MKRYRVSMGMPAAVEIIGGNAADIDAVYEYFDEIDARFSPYRADSEIARMNRGTSSTPSAELAEILSIAAVTRTESGGFFDIRRPDGTVDPTGIVKGWALQNAAELLVRRGRRDFCIELGGDIACSGKNAEGGAWRVGVRNPFAHGETVRVVAVEDAGIATSGSAARGDHIYNPHRPGEAIRDVASITVVGPDILTADRYATAAFAMGKDGVSFIEALPGCEAYQIGADGVACMTSGFRALTV